MPAIRDEEWFYSPSFQEGADALSRGEKDVRFCGLLLGQDTLDIDAMEKILNALKNSKSKSLSIDWFNVESESFNLIEQMSNDDFEYQLNAFHLTMIDLSEQSRLSAASTIISNNKHIVDLVLTFCGINDDNVHILADALARNETILSLNINFNMLKKAGYLRLADSLGENKTLRYLEAKLNKAEKADLVEFTNKLSTEVNNVTLEYMDLGQEDDIDGKIVKNKIPEPQNTKVSKDKKSVEKTITTKDAQNLNAEVGGQAPAVLPVANNDNNADNNAPAEDVDLYTLVKNYLQANKERRQNSEKELKIGQLKTILDNEAETIRASLKHCKIMMLGDKGVGKTFFAHCLVHQLYLSNEADTQGTRKIQSLSTARVTELGWTKISAFHHVDMVLAKKISTLPINVQNRNKANEVCFQFPDQVVIKASDLKTDMLDKENQELLKRLDIQKEEIEEKPVFLEAEKEVITERFSNGMSDIIDKALRENNYPSFSLWDVDSPAGFNEIFSFFYNNHGMIFVFFSLVHLKTNPERVLASIKEYLEPIQLAKQKGKDFTSKVFIIGTFLDEVLNQGIDTSVEDWAEKYDKYNANNELENPSANGHLSFIQENLKDEHQKPFDAITHMLKAFNVELTDFLGTEYNNDIVANDGDDLLFFPLSNKLPEMCKNFEKDFDDISGINKFRAKVRSLIDDGKIKVIEVMKGLKDAKIIDALVERKNNVDKKTNKDKYMTMSEFEAMAYDAGITSRADIIILLRYLDVTGIVSWISDTQILQNVIVLNPEYIIDGLKTFYTALTENENKEAELKKLDENADVEGLREDFTMLQSRIVTHDLLYQKLLKRENFEYFKSFLELSWHLNEINYKVLTSVFTKQNLCSNNVSDNIYLVPNFTDNVAVNLEHKLFTSFKAKFVPSDGVYQKGAFERAVTSIIDGMNNSVMEEKMKETENILSYSSTSALFEFGEAKFSIEQVKENDEKYLQVSFTKEGAEKMYGFVDTVFRNTSSWDSFVLKEKEWVPTSTAKKEMLSPYFQKSEETFLSEDLEEAFDFL